MVMMGEFSVRERLIGCEALCKPEKHRSRHGSGHARTWAHQYAREGLVCIAAGHIHRYQARDPQSRPKVAEAIEDSAGEIAVARPA